MSILLLITIVARPAFYIGYFGYYKWNIDEIIEKYCVNKELPQLQCNGKCHLMKTLAITQVSEDAEHPISINIAEAFIFVYYQDVAINWRFFFKGNSFF